MKDSPVMMLFPEESMWSFVPGASEVCLKKITPLQGLALLFTLQSC